MSDTRGATEVSGVQEFRCFAGDEWRAAENNELFDAHVCRPFDRRLYARVAAGGRTEATIAVDESARAIPAWSRTSPAERARLFSKAAEVVKRRRVEHRDGEHHIVLNIPARIGGRDHRAGGRVDVPSEGRSPGNEHSGCPLSIASADL